jgi:hypothetical protein
MLIKNKKFYNETIKLKAISAIIISINLIIYLDSKKLSLVS